MAAARRPAVQRGGPSGHRAMVLIAGSRRIREWPKSPRGHAARCRRGDGSGGSRPDPGDDGQSIGGGSRARGTIRRGARSGLRERPPVFDLLASLPTRPRFRDGSPAPKASHATGRLQRYFPAATDDPPSPHRCSRRARAPNDQREWRGRGCLLHRKRQRPGTGNSRSEQARQVCAQTPPR